MTGRNVCGVRSWKTLSLTLAMSMVAIPVLAAPPEMLAVVTTDALKNNSTMMGAFVAFKRQTRPTIVVTETKTYLSNGVTQNAGWAGGITLPAPSNLEHTQIRAEAIRTWLKANYTTLGIKDVLLVGNPCPRQGDLPMKAFWPLKTVEWDYPNIQGYRDEYCMAPSPAPNRNSLCTQWQDKHYDKRMLPNDYYYSNLTYMWPLDSDGDVKIIKDTDFTHQDVHVGRIQVTGGNIATLDKILAKSIAYASSTDTAWRKSALLSMNTHDIQGTRGGISGSYVPYGEVLRTSLLVAQGFSSYRIHWQFSSADCESLIDNPTEYNRCLSEVGIADVNQVSVVNMGSVWAGSAWPQCAGSICSQPKRNFGLVHWTGHGGSQSAADAIDVSYSGNYTEYLDDRHPAFVVSQSCSPADPQVANNIPAALLRNGAIGFMGATSVSWPAASFWSPVLYSTSAGSTDVTYGFISELVVSGLPAGQAMSQMRSHLAPVVASVVGDDYRKRDYAAQLLLFNYFGDPTIGMTNPTNPGVIPLPSDTPNNINLTAGGPAVVLYADNWPSKGNPYWTANVVLSVNSLTGRPIPRGTVWVNGVSYSIGGGNQYYQELNIPDTGPYTVEVSTTAASMLQLTLGNR